MLRKIFLFLLLLISPCLADDNPRLVGYPPDKIMGFRGLDTNNSVTNIEDGRAVDLLNVKLSNALNLKKRYGKSVINGTLDDFDLSSPPITGIFDSEYSTGESWTLAFVGSKLKYDNSGTWSTVNGSATITSGQDNQWMCQMALDNAICINNVDKPLQVSKTPTKSEVSFTGLSNPVTKANAVIWYRNYLIFGNTTENSISNPTRFRWSDVGTIGTWTNTNYVDISSLGGDSIVGFQEMYGDLYIFMQKSIWKASLVGGNDVFTFTKVVDGFGAISKESIKLVNLSGNRVGVIYMNENKKIYLFNGAVVTDIGNIIQPTLDDLNASRLQYSVGGYDDTTYYLSVSDGGLSKNDIVLVYEVEIGEWTKFDDLDFNAFARVKESTATIKSYIGNYYAFVYWMDNPSNNDDVSGATGIFDSVGYVNTSTETGAQILIDTGITSGIYTGATVKITSGTGAPEEAVVLTSTSTGVVLVTTMATTPDSTSNYTIGSINSYYQTKWYDFGSSPRFKTFRALYFWAKEASNNSVDISYLEDFQAETGSSTISLSPSSSSLWDEALWDVATWGTTGDKFYSMVLTGKGKFLSIKFSQDDIDKSYTIYGYHMLADRLDVQ